MSKNVEESRSSGGGEVTDLGSVRSATLEAESVLESLVSSLTDQNIKLEELPRLMKMYMLALRLLGMDDEWASRELKGSWGDGEVPIYRQRYSDVEYVEAESGKLVEKGREDCEFGQSVLYLASHRKQDWWWEIGSARKTLGASTVRTKKRMRPSEWDKDNVLERISEELFDRATTTLVAARFGSAIDTIFRDYQRVVSSTLSNLEIEDHLDTAYRNLRGGNEANWRAAALACRNVLHDLSTKLWCVKCGDYNFDDGQGLVKLNNPRIKLRAYMREKGLNKKDAPVALLEPVYADASAGKTQCSYEDARSVLILTYLFLAELIRETDMKPIMEIEKRV
ncbi:MAG: hypothetical protein ACXADO_10200 [Candidatus Thorarchaeota archaeon]